VDGEPDFNAEMRKTLVEDCTRQLETTRNWEKAEKKSIEARRKYLAGVRKEKLNSWKEFCNATASSN